MRDLIHSETGVLFDPARIVPAKLGQLHIGAGLEQTFDKAALSVLLADSLTPVDVGGGTSIVGVAARLDCRDYQYTLHPVGSKAHSTAPSAGGAAAGGASGGARAAAAAAASAAAATTAAGSGGSGVDAAGPHGRGGSGSLASSRGLLFGSLKTQKVVQALASYGIRDVRILQEDGADVIELGALGARIRIGAERTLIETKGNEALRLMLRDAVVSLLTAVSFG